MRLVVVGGLYVWNVVWWNSFLCRITGGNIQQNHEPHCKFKIVILFTSCYTQCISIYISFESLVEDHLKSYLNLNDYLILQYSFIKNLFSFHVLFVLFIWIHIILSNCSYDWGQILLANFDSFGVPMLMINKMKSITIIVKDSFWRGITVKQSLISFSPVCIIFTGQIQFSFWCRSVQ